MISILVVVGMLAGSVYLLLQQPQFGKAPSGERLARVLRSPHYKEGSFRNLSETHVQSRDVSFLRLFYEFIFKQDKLGIPPVILPSVREDLRMPAVSGAPEVTWFGHSSYLIRISGKVILVDPVFGERVSPVSIFGAKRFEGTAVYRSADLPAADVIVITHDHYDHLDYDFIKDHAAGKTLFITSLGVGAHLEYWGVAKARIVELDWWEEYTGLDGFRFVAAPARHFSGRGIRRGETLWSSFVLQAGGYSLYLGGDSGYDGHFADIGARYGPFDMAILESGQYGKYWPDIHMFPEQTVQAAIDLKARVLFPVHWAKFQLGMHAWDEPIRRVSKAAADLDQQITTPMIGEKIMVGSHYPASRWWEGQAP